MTDPLRARLAALIAEWRTRAPLLPIELMPAEIMRECAHDLKAALRAAPTDHAARAHALRDALCDILSATGASAHAIPRLAMEALARDEAFCEARAAAPDVAHRHRCVGCGLRWTDLPGAELCGDCWRTAQPHVHARAAAPEEP